MKLPGFDLSTEHRCSFKSFLKMDPAILYFIFFAAYLCTVLSESRKPMEVDVANSFVLGKPGECSCFQVAACCFTELIVVCFVQQQRIVGVFPPMDC